MLKLSCFDNWDKTLAVHYIISNLSKVRTLWTLPWAIVITLYYEYRQFSNMSRTQSPNTNVSRLGLQLSLSNPLKPGIKSRMNM